jgi:hypothetical protein
MGRMRLAGRELFDAARDAIDALRDHARDTGMDFRRRDPLVLTLHDVVDLAEQGLPEVCVCAGLRMPNGYIIRGHRHDDCMATMGKMFPGERATQQMQGFVTSRGRWVDRYEAAGLQRKAGIASRIRGTIEPYYPEMLFSEDLY